MLVNCSRHSELDLEELQGLDRKVVWCEARRDRHDPVDPAFEHQLFLITPSYIAHCMGACIAKGEWSLSFLSLSSLSRLSTPCSPQYIERDFF